VAVNPELNIKDTVGLSPVQRYLEYLHERFHGVRDGALANYIPELTLADPDWFGIAIATVDGHVYQVGETRQAFTIQSISKALTYGLALEDNGLEHVLGKVGVEPSGDAFNSISLDPASGRPLNPMINAGAIATTGMIKGDDHEQRLTRILEAFSRYVGHPLAVNEDVYRSESATGHRNRAIGYMLRNFNILEQDPTDTLELYFQQCSINVNCRDLALAAATLANGGVNPITGVIALRKSYIEKVLSVMSTCGMYDYAGSWIYEVGMPAKSGVGGGIMAVLPGQLGIGVFSPLLDAKGNSVRAIEVCRQLSRDFSLHIFNAARITPSVVRAKYHGAGVRSKRQRNMDDCRSLEKLGNATCVYELLGDLMFGTTEIVIADLLREIDSADFFILDLKRVFSIDEASTRLLLDLCELLHSRGKWVFFTYTENKYTFTKNLRRKAGALQSPDVLAFAENDVALEWCENQLLGREASRGDGTSSSIEVPLESQPLLEGLTDEEMECLKELMRPLEFKLKDLIIRKGDVADNVYFLTRGEVSVILPLERKHARLATLSAGMAFGEMALIEDGHRTADVSAETDVKCYALAKDALLSRSDAVAREIQRKLLHNVARALARNLHMAYAEIRALA